MFSVLLNKILEISTLSTPEYINIVGQYNYLIHGASIDPGIYVRGYTEAQIEQLKKSAIPRTIKSCNLQITKPLEEFQFKGFDYAYGLYNSYKDGFLPFNGPVSEQPARIIEIFNLFSQLEHEQQERASKEQKADGDRRHSNKVHNRR